MTKYRFVKQTSETSCTVITFEYMWLGLAKNIVGGLLGCMRAAERLAARVSSALTKGAKFVGLTALGLYDWFISDPTAAGVKKRIARAQRMAEKQSPELAQELSTLEEAMQELEEDRKLENIFHKTLVMFNVLWAIVYIMMKLI